VKETHFWDYRLAMTILEVSHLDFTSGDGIGGLIS
jgi:hypothetical protein